MRQAKRKFYSASAIADAKAFVDTLEAEALPTTFRPSTGLRSFLYSLFKAGETSPVLAKVLGAGMTRQEIKTYVDGIIADLLAYLPSADRDFLRQFPVGLVRTGNPNAFPILTPSGVPAILLDVWLARFISVSNKVSLCTGEWEDEEIRNLMLLNIHSFLFPEDPDSPLAKRFFKTPTFPSAEVANIYARTIHAQEMFVIAHEYSHLLLGHLDRTSLTPRELISSRATKVDEFRRSHRDEFDADARASGWCRKVYEGKYPPVSKDDRRVEISLQLGETFLVYCRLVEGLAQNLSNIHALSDTHPSAVERLKRLRRSTSVNLLESSERFYFERVFPELSDTTRPEGKFPFCDWYMEKAKTMDISPKEIVEHFAACPKCSLTWNYLMAHQ